jgi:hypothetical protein
VTIGGAIGTGPSIAPTTPQPSGTTMESYENGQPPATPLSRRIKIPWRMYKMVNGMINRKKGYANAKIIGGAIDQWWNNNKQWNADGMPIKGLQEVYISHLNLVIDKVPIMENNILKEYIGIMPIATFSAQDQFKVNDNDFVFSGTMKISKTDPEEIFSVQIDGIDACAGKYQMSIN